MDSKNSRQQSAISKIGGNMSDTVKKDITDVAATAMKAPTVMKRKEVQGELNFIRNADELDEKMEADNIVARFPDPDGGEPIDFEMVPMTPGQFSVYYQTLFGHSLLDAKETVGATNPNPEMPELDDDEVQRMQDELAIKKYDMRLLNILETNISGPPGITAKRLRKWDPLHLMFLHNALLGGSRPSKPVAQFPDVDSEGGE